MRRDGGKVSAIHRALIEENDGMGTANGAGSRLTGWSRLAWEGGAVHMVVLGELVWTRLTGCGLRL
jgi:hypothetical protein